jgi:hypothetical protein
MLFSSEEFFLPEFFLLSEMRLQLILTAQTIKESF